MAHKIPLNQEASQYYKTGGQCCYCGAYMQDGNAVCSDCATEMDGLASDCVTEGRQWVQEGYLPTERECDCWINHGLDDPVLCPFHTGVSWAFDAGTEVLDTWRKLKAAGWTGSLARAIWNCLPRPHSEQLNSILRSFPLEPSRSISVEYEARPPQAIALFLMHSGLDTHSKFTLGPSSWQTVFGPTSTLSLSGPTLGLDGQVTIPINTISLQAFTDVIHGERINTARLRNVFYVLLDMILLAGLNWEGRIHHARQCAISVSRLKLRHEVKDSALRRTFPSQISYSNPSPALLKDPITPTYGQRYPKRPGQSPGSPAWHWLPASP